MYSPQRKAEWAEQYDLHREQKAETEMMKPAVEMALNPVLRGFPSTDFVQSLSELQAKFPTLTWELTDLGEKAVSIVLKAVATELAPKAKTK